MALAEDDKHEFIHGSECGKDKRSETSKVLH